MSSPLIASPPIPSLVAREKSGNGIAPTDEALSEDRYGDFIDSVYEGILTDDEFNMLPRYGKQEVLLMNGLEELDARYTISRYLYASVQDFNHSAWFGFVAASKPEHTKLLGCQEIVIALRGTLSKAEWEANVERCGLVPCKVIDPTGCAHVHAGFYGIYSATNPAFTFGATSLRSQIFEEIEELVGACKESDPLRIVVTGHSLGAALATIATADLCVNFATSRSNVSVRLVVYGSPRVGNREFKTLVENMIPSKLEIQRYSNVGDAVPLVPLRIPFFFEYFHVGEEIRPDWRRSPYTKKFLPVWDCHNLQLYLHTIAAKSFEERQLKSATSADTLMESIENPENVAAVKDLRRKYGDEAMENFIPCLEDLVSMEEKARIDEHPKVKRLRVTFRPDTSAFDTRDYTLLNKGTDILKESFKIPDKWMVPLNKDMKQENGKWLTRSKRPSDIPTPTNQAYN